MVATGLLIGAGVIGLAFVALGVISPLLLIPILVLASFPLALGVLGRLFANSQPTVDATKGPAVPSTSEASYDPVNQPR